MSDTPETDTELNYGAFGFYTMGGLPAFAVGAEFARELERERDAAQKAMGDARDILLDAMPDANAPTKILAEMIVAERDKYQEQADALLIRLGATQERMINAERKRDDLSNELNDTIRSCHIWQDGHSKIVELRNQVKSLQVSNAILGEKIKEVMTP